MHTQPTRIQLCGKLVVELSGTRCEDGLRGRQSRLLFGYLAVHRRRGIARDELVEALWPDRAPESSDGDLRVLASRMRRALGTGLLQGRSSLQLVLPARAWIDVEAADAAIHRAESAVQRGDWKGGWAPSHIALNVSRRTFMAGLEAPWIDEIRRHLEDVRLRALDCWTTVGLGIGGAELADAEAAARKLIAEAPLRERGYALLMRVLDVRGDPAEAVSVYEQLRKRLNDELGIAPGPKARELHARILLRGDEQ